MKIVHTSDWHLGGRLHDQDRYAEHEAFGAWLLDLLRQEQPDALIVAGDIFDTCAPSNRAQEIYFGLLAALYKEDLCRAVIIAGGNHDSPSLLDAPAMVLSHLHIRVVGAIDPADPGRQVVLVPDRAGVPGLVVAAVPYLRDGDLRTAVPGETEPDRAARLGEGFRAHYEAIARRARAEARAQTGRDLPLVLTGHLYLTGATVSDERSERAMRVGNLGALPQDLLPAADYCALGHLHTPQALGAGACGYSGSPLPMSFAEAGQEKSVALVEFGPAAGDPVVTRRRAVPVFQPLEQVRGAPEGIRTRLLELARATGSEPPGLWVEVQVTEGDDDLRAFWGELPRLVDGSAVRILACQNCRPQALAAAAREVEAVGLEHLAPQDVFAMRLADEPGLADEERAWLSARFAEVLNTVLEADPRRE